MDEIAQICPLCHKSSSYFFVEFEPQRIFYQCENCDLIFQISGFITPEDEKNRYMAHENHIPDQGYIDFLGKLLTPLKGFITVSMKGLDYGSGPYPMLQKLMTESGYQMDIYDPYFCPKSIDAQAFDYISCTEVIEHFRFPAEDFKKIDACAKNGSVLAFMSGIYYQGIDFKNWHYPKDPTHISIYTPKTLEYLAKYFYWKLVYFEKNVAIFIKENRP